jgi:hypothetical protein
MSGQTQNAILGIQKATGGERNYPGKINSSEK